MLLVITLIVVMIVLIVLPEDNSKQVMQEYCKLECVEYLAKDRHYSINDKFNFL